MLGGIPGLQQSQLQNSKRTIEKSLLVPLILPRKASLLLVARTRSVSETVDCVRISYMFSRPLPSTTFATPRREFISSSHTLMRSCTSRGHLTLHQYSLPHRVIGASTYGILHRLGSNRLLTTRKMDHQNSCLSTEASHSIPIPWHHASS